MNTSLWSADDPLNAIPTRLRDSLRSMVHQLYSYDLPNAKGILDKLIQDVEVHTTTDDVIVDDLTLKLSRDLYGYVDFEDAVWLLGQRANRAAEDGKPETKFRALFNCALLAEQGDDAEITQVFNERLRSQADLTDDPVKKLLVDVMVAMSQHRQRRLEETKLSLETIKQQLNQVSSLVPEAQGDNIFYLIVAFERSAFLFRKKGDKESFNYYHRKALNLCQRREWDLGLQMELETNLIRALKTSGKAEDMGVYVASLLFKLEQSLQNLDGFQVRFGTKVLRDAYNDVSVACSFLQLSKEQLLSTGEQLYEAWKLTLGSEHTEVLFLASQLAYNYETFDMKEDAEKYLAIVENSIETFPETTKIVMQAKAKTLIHLWKIYRNRDQLDEAEYYCREEIRVNRKHGICQQYVANALRNLAFIVRDQGRLEQGLNYLKECLELSREYSPDLLAFHEKVQNEIKKFLLG